MWFNDFLQKRVSADSHYFHFRSFRALRALRIQKLSNCCRQSISRILLYFLAGFWLFGPTLYRPAADFVGAGGGFSSLVVRSFQLFHPLVGKQLSSAICQSANRGQIRGLLSWCCCYCCSPSGSKFNEHKNTVLCNHFAGVNLFSYDFTAWLFQFICILTGIIEKNCDGNSSMILLPILFRKEKMAKEFFYL